MTEDEACFTGSEKRFFICLKSLAPMTPEKELPVSHEMGHLWLTLHSFPRENRNISDEQQKRYDSLFGPLLEVMEHAIFYPWLKNNYGIDLYRVGNQRLVDFLKNKFPNRKNESQGDQVSLILNYIKFKVESNSSYWQERFSRAYSKNKFIDLKLVGERVLPIIQELASKPPDPQYFIKKYREVLETMNIEQELWPDFCSLVKKY
ncbi:MAG: hypothetical protein HY578_02235 [Nitrospinae bacterium]|nr:hypothetical protein [Nitrospinota bacterium]